MHPPRRNPRQSGLVDYPGARACRARRESPTHRAEFIMDRPPFSTVLSAAVASAAAFYVITRSGIAGTLAGAAVASLVYTGASHGVRHAAGAAGPQRAAMVASRPQGLRSMRRIRRSRSKKATERSVPVDAVSAAIPRVSGVLRGASWPTWGPMLLAVAALAASLYSMSTGTPIERIVVRERVVEKPVVTERVVIQTETVTVTQPAQGHGAQPRGGRADHHHDCGCPRAGRDHHDDLGRRRRPPPRPCTPPVATTESAPPAP